MLQVTKAEFVDKYEIHVWFNDGQSGVVDLQDALWGPVFEPLKDPAVFRRFTVSPVLHTICWDNGADLAPEYLYDKMAEQSRASHALPPRH